MRGAFKEAWDYMPGVQKFLTVGAVVTAVAGVVLGLISIWWS